MKITITGSLGHIGKPLAEELVKSGHETTVISSQAERQKDIEALGAKAAVGSLEDVDFLVSAFTGADAVYAMIPPNYNRPDILGYYRTLGENYAQAIKQSGVKRVVHQSSWGADLDKGTGFILGSHFVEGILNELPPDVAVTHLRAGFIYYNLYGFVEMIKAAGFIGSNYGGDDVIVMSDPLDIAAAAAEELTKSSTGKNARYVASDERTASEAARVLGAAIGKPDLQWQILTDEQTRNGMQQAGVPENIIDGTIELGSAIHNDVMRKGYEQNKPNAFGKIKLEDFAKEFAASF